MSLILIENFAANPDWSRVSVRQLNRAQELVALIQSQSNVLRNQQSEDYYGWIVELKKLLDT
ncbi:hypothetical protein [Acaryochloris sp. IP29b_bin.148]|uniref:hypothetical protein n=1 Tax=Acaryochloris sp. IP29b_bin.148 TaxID=2969218 RepID=UPI00260759A6|nr:hypothetical protein [Acaryochloris sp. IP29b_bin.148]